MITEILFEDNDVLVCHKRAGIAVQTAGIGMPDMVSELKNYLSIKTKEKDPYLGVVHRLDQPVEGIIVFAKNAKSAAALSDQARGDSKAQSLKMKKYYEAVVFGHMPEQSGTLMDEILKSGRTNLSEVVRKQNGSQTTKLTDEVIEETDKAQRLKICLYTGRHHQIRVQLAHAGCPILGDLKYGTAEAIAWAKNNGYKTLQLKANHLEFMHPTTKKVLKYYLEG